MVLEDYLMPGEEIRFSSSTKVKYGQKDYQVFITDKRLIMYARRGTIFKNDDVVSVQLAELHGITYEERGIINKQGVLNVQGRTLIQLTGPAKDTKALYQQVMQFL